MIYIGNLKQRLQKWNISHENLNFGAIHNFIWAPSSKKRFANGNLKQSLLNWRFLMETGQIEYSVKLHWIFPMKISIWAPFNVLLDIPIHCSSIKNILTTEMIHLHFLFSLAKFKITYRDFHWAPFRFSFGRHLRFLWILLHILAE